MGLGFVWLLGGSVCSNSRDAPLHKSLLSTEPSLPPSWELFVSLQQCQRSPSPLLWVHKSLLSTKPSLPPRWELFVPLHTWAKPNLCPLQPRGWRCCDAPSSVAPQFNQQELFGAPQIHLNLLSQLRFGPCALSCSIPYLTHRVPTALHVPMALLGVTGTWQGDLADPWQGR